MQKKFLKILFIFLTLLCVNAVLNAQEKSDYRWKEVMRLDNEQYTVSYLDTIMLHSEDRVTMTIFRNGIGYKAVAFNDKIDFVIQGFNIFKNTQDTIILSNSKGYHIFKRDLVNQDYSDAVQKMKELELPEQPQAVIDLFQLIGSWKAYKRINRSGPSKRLKHSQMLSRVEVLDGTDANFYSSSNNQVPSLKLKSIGDGYFVTLDENGEEQLIQVFKADKDELIIEDERGVVYYFIQFE